MRNESPPEIKPRNCPEVFLQKGGIIEGTDTNHYIKPIAEKKRQLNPNSAIPSIQNMLLVKTSNTKLQR